jgi:hypothetical protein
MIDDEGDPIFHRIPGIHQHEVARMVDGVSRRVIMSLRKSGKLSAEGEEFYIGDQSDAKDFKLSHLKRASISSRMVGCENVKTEVCKAHSFEAKTCTFRKELAAA